MSKTRPQSNRRSIRYLVSVMAAALVAAPLAVSAAGPANAIATTRYVATNGSDTDGSSPNACTGSATPCRTIQHAVDEADAGDVVSITSGTYAESIEVRKNMTFVGAGPTTPNISGDGGGDPSITIEPDDEAIDPLVSVNQLAVSGNTSGAGVEVLAATVTLHEDTVGDNGEDGVEVFDAGNLVVTGSVINRNSHTGIDIDDGTRLTMKKDLVARNGRAGIDLQQGIAVISHNEITNNAGGGVVVGFPHPATATITTSTFRKNGGVGIGVGESGNVTVSRSTVSTSVPYAGSAAERYGGGMVAVGGTLIANEDTVYGNTNFGIAIDPTPSGNPRVDIANSTISATRRGKGSALIGGLVTSGAKAQFTVVGTIDADNKTVDCADHVTDAGYNLASDKTCGLNAAGSKQNTPADLGKLVDNGGPTKTAAPKSHSPAIDAIRAGHANCSSGATDQRGQPRREPTHGKCDVGSVEVKAKTHHHRH